MPRRLVKRLSDMDREFLAQIRGRHPGRRTDARALHAEIMTAPRIEDQTRAAIVYALLGCRWGFGQLKKRIAALAAIVEANPDEWLGPPERKLLNQLLFAAAVMDTARSHRLLVGLLRSPSHLVRADVLEEMAFEKERFEPELVLPFLSDSASTPEILSALYTLQYWYGKARPAEARARVAPFLGHSYSSVRASAVRLLMFGTNPLDLIQSLADDPHPDVRSAVEEAIRRAETLG